LAQNRGYRFLSLRQLYRADGWSVKYAEWNCGRKKTGLQIPFSVLNVAIKRIMGINGEIKTNFSQSAELFYFAGRWVKT